jgi:K+/H+ antiporter YhaU regulatory subunit KhtT
MKRWTRRCASSPCTGAPAFPSCQGIGSTCAGWITRRDVLDALARSIETAGSRIEAGAIAADFGAERPERAAPQPSAPLDGFQILELRITPGSPAAGRRIGDIRWPQGALVVAVTDVGETMPADPQTLIRAGERIILLAPVQSSQLSSNGPL